MPAGFVGGQDQPVAQAVERKIHGQEGFNQGGLSAPG